MGRWLLAALVLACGEAARPPAPAPDAGGEVTADAAALEDGPSADGSVPLADFAARYCALLATCCPDGAQCREVVAARAPYRAAMAEGCLAALQAGAATPAFCTAGYAAAAQACQRVFATVVASKRLGEPCRENEECLLSPQGRVRCAGITGMARCLVELRGKEGESPCIATVGGPVTIPAGEPTGSSPKGYLCHVADGLWCNEASMKCEKTKAPGAACVGFGECGVTHHCDDATAMCAPRRDQGAACDVDEQCPSTLCGEDNVCAPTPAVDAELARSCLRP